MEVEAERADEVLDAAQATSRGRKQLASVGRAAATEVDRLAPHALDEAQEVLALLLDDDLTEQRAEQLDLARERVAGAGRADPARLGTHRGVLLARSADAGGHDGNVTLWA